ncbi:carbohydrate-binding protein [Algibacter mikhailovii]|uniref:carbohydrate-binding protein n=1 Tax=Algibacter mikhailovii TaxID=425498 RepID=UPI0024950747|nr:carbohydrate-binding protein [Algibacter mikhailovii]
MKKKLLIACFPAIFLLIGNLNAQTVIHSLQELVPYLDDDNAHVKLTPGTYTVTAANINNGTYGFLVPGVISSTQNAVFLFSGNNSTYDFTDVTINIKTEVLSSFGRNDVREIQIIGNNNVLLNLTTVDDGSVNDAPGRRATNIVIDGANNRVEGFHVSVKGSYPYGYGDIFGKGGGSTIGHQKHSACLVRGNSNHLKNCTFISRSYGHGIFMQAANDALIEGCHVEGEHRTIAEVLAEEGTGSPADNVNFQTVWGYDLRNVTNNYRFSCQEDGIRDYNGGTTIVDGVEYERTVNNTTVINCTIINMRSGVALGLGKGSQYVENCTALGCESGFWVKNSTTIVNSRGDASVGPLYSEDAERSGVTAELTLLDNHVTKIGNTPSLYIAGSSHNFTLHDGTTSFNDEIEILISGKRYAHRFLEGSGEEPPNRNADGVTFNNYTKYPIVLGANASNNTVNSCGSITNNGSNNIVNYSETCEFPTCQKTAALIEAECFDGMSGIEIEANHIGYIQNGDWVMYSDIDLSNMTLATARGSSKGSGGNIELRLGSTTGTLIGTIEIPITGNWNSWVTRADNITSVTGKNDVYAVFTGGSGYLFNLDWISFENTLSINDLSLGQIKFYPNPAITSISITNAANTTLEVYNIQGTLEMKTEISEDKKEITLKNLSSGVHFFKFKNEQGTMVKKLIKP